MSQKVEHRRGSIRGMDLHAEYGLDLISGILVALPKQRFAERTEGAYRRVSAPGQKSKFEKFFILLHDLEVKLILPEKHAKCVGNWSSLPPQ